MPTGNIEVSRSKEKASRNKWSASNFKRYNGNHLESKTVMN
jgi:hypothetical protein